MKPIQSLPRILALLAVAGIAAGCGKGNDATAPVTAASPGSADQSEITSVLAMVPELGEDDLFMSEEETSIGSQVPGASSLQSGAGSFAAIRPLRWWRHIADVDRRFEFEFTHPDSNGDPQRAIVTIHKRLRGTFNIATWAGDDSANVMLTSDGHDDIRIVRKRLADHWARRVLLERVRRRDGDRTVWRIAATSGVKVSSIQPEDAKHAPTKILSLAVRTADGHRVITDPLAFVRLREILRVSAGQLVQLTVTTEATDDIVVLLHRGDRFRFRNNGDGTYTGVWRVPRVEGIHHFGVNALSNGTLLDDEVPYNSDAWILPYVNVGLDRDVMPDA